MKLCIVCGTEPAAVPDRDKPGSWRKEVCGRCHAERLLGDVERIFGPGVRAEPTEEQPGKDGL